MKSQEKNTPKNNPTLFRAFKPSDGRYFTKYPPYWSPYKTVQEKLKYQKRIPTEIQPFVRKYFVEHMDELLSHQSESTLEYLDSTTNAWSKHIEVNRQIDCFLFYVTRNIFGDWSPDEWKIARRLLVAGMSTDHLKTMYSGGIKRKIDLESKKLCRKYESVDPEFSTTLMVPSFVTFYVAWELDHLKYFLCMLCGDSTSDIKRILIDNYHSGDEALFNCRLGEVIEKYGCFGPDRLKSHIEHLEKICRKNAIKKRYATFGRVDLMEFEELLEFDNTTEYEYTYSLKGLPDLFLREEIFRRLVGKNKINKERSVFSISLNEFIVCIDEVIKDEESHFTIRLRGYLQNYDTCGTACIMSILNRRGTPLNEETELRIWDMVGRPYNFPGGLAEVLLRNKFHVTYVQNNPELLDKNNPEFYTMSEQLLDAAKAYIDLFEKALDTGLRFCVEDWGYERVYSEIMRGNPCLLYLHVSDTVTHVVLAHGIKGNHIKIMDPLGYIKYLSEDELNSKIINPMGKRLLIVNKLPYDFFDVLSEKLSAIGY